MLNIVNKSLLSIEIYITKIYDGWRLLMEIISIHTTIRKALPLIRKGTKTLLIICEVYKKSYISFMEIISAK